MLPWRSVSRLDGRAVFSAREMNNNLPLKLVFSPVTSFMTDHFLVIWREKGFTKVRPLNVCCLQKYSPSSSAASTAPSSLTFIRNVYICPFS